MIQNIQVAIKQRVFHSKLPAYFFMSKMDSFMIKHSSGGDFLSSSK